MTQTQRSRLGLLLAVAILAVGYAVLTRIAPAPPPVVTSEESAAVTYGQFRSMVERGDIVAVAVSGRAIEA